MTFQELTSAFRTEKENLVAVLKAPKWERFRINFEHFDQIVHQQNRAILDEEIPFDLAKEVCEKSELTFYLYYESQPQILTTRKKETVEKFEPVSSLDILLRYGGEFIEETLEKGISEVSPKPIGNNVEVLGVFNISNIGTIAILRTTRDKLEKGDILCSADATRAWEILEEAQMTLSPISAYEKKERQKEQGIREYLIQSIKGDSNPIEGEILRKK